MTQQDTATEQNPWSLETPEVAEAQEQAMSNLEAAKAEYQEKRQALENVLSNIERNRKAMAEASKEAEALNQEWKRDLHNNAGSYSPTISKKIDQSAAARKRAEELSAMVEQSPEIQDQVELEALDARDKYISCLNQARRLINLWQFDAAISEAMDSHYSETTAAINAAGRLMHEWYLEEKQKYMALRGITTGAPLALASITEEQDRDARAVVAERMLQYLEGYGLDYRGTEGEYDNPEFEPIQMLAAEARSDYRSVAVRSNRRKGFKLTKNPNGPAFEMPGISRI